ncbi:MAG: hypothetical protein R3293_16255 [Candidatus Promineifilaceae bacterium]|nr:hypothetical protein [Candidatus Promineifilaceae bacterium]
MSNFLFLVENFFPYAGSIRHSLEHYFQITLDKEQIIPISDGVQFFWMPIAELPALDLRPAIVRDSIADGSYKQLELLRNLRE